MSSRKTVPGKTLPPGPPSGLASSMSPTSNHVSVSYSRPFKAQQHTPPPDNFGYIKSCTHIKSVLESKARENVLITYKQAVSISTAVSENDGNKIYTQKKDGSIVSKKKLVDLKLKSLKCSDCSLNNFHQNFICLQCPHVGCYSNLNHAYTHYKSHQHLFAIDSSNGLLYCFQCGDYVNNPSLEKIRSDITNNKADDNENNEEEEEDEDDEYDEYENKQLQERIDSHYINPSSNAVNGLKGFINLGSTCFMSCILQSFIHNPIMKYQFFNNDVHYFNCNINFDYLIDGESIDEENACITCSIDKIFQDFYTSNNHEGFGMTNLLMTAWYKKKSLAGFQEQDAHEFWQFLLNEFHLDYERIQKNLTGQDYNNNNNNFNHKKHKQDICQCITHTIFSGELQSSIKCLNCDSLTTTIDPLIDLSLEINRIKSKSNNEPISLYDCLDLFTKDEKLDVMYTCQYCNSKSKAIKSLKIKKLPPVLSIQLKRFEHNLFNDTSSKIQLPVKTPLYLDFTKYTSDCEYNESNEPILNTNKIYELFTVVSHIGSVNTGHYIVMVKNGSGQWFKFDDSVISMVSQEEVINTNAYLLFYITHRI